MQKHMTATAARKNFFDMLKMAQKPGSSVTITLEGLPTVVVMSAAEFDGWMETLDILSNPDEAAELREALKEKEKGDTVSFEEFQKSLNL